ncbi:MAG: universal stress protein [Actinomycetota bacterium]|nr:universal stress protein [Actinomycetota bacterium]
MSSATLTRPFTQPDPVPSLEAAFSSNGPVLVAVDDEANAAVLLSRGHDAAVRLGVALRVVHIWSRCRPPDCSHHRRCHRDMEGANRFSRRLLDEHLPEATAPVEREVVHDENPASALVALSVGASLLFIGAEAAGEAVGETTRALLDRAACPVTVVRDRPRSARVN